MVNKIPTLDLWPEPSPFQNRTSRLQKDHNWKTLGLYGPKFSKWAYSFEERVSNLINGVEQPNEIVDAHLSGSTGMKFKTITDRMNYMEDNAATKEDLQFSTSYATLRRLGQKYRKQGSIASNAQGFASLGNQIVVQYFQNRAPLDTNYGQLVQFDVTDGNEIVSNEIKGFHGNAMTYNSDDQMLYLVTSDGKGDGRILQISSDTLEIRQEIDLSEKMKVTQVHSIGYDNVDKMFVVTDNQTLDFYDNDWNRLYTLQWVDFVDFEPDWMQGVQCNGDMLYWIGGRKSQIWTFKIDKKNKDLLFKTIYTFDDFQENLYPTGEIEGMGFNYENGKVYICSHISVGNYGGLTEYFETNANFRTVGRGSQSVTHQTTNPEPVIMYAGANGNYNPDGTKDNPFASLLEATTCMRTPYTPFVQLTLLSAFDETLYLVNVNDAMILAQNHAVKGVVIINSRNVYTPYLHTTSYSHWHYNALYIYNSQVRINSFEADDISSEPSAEEYVHIERSSVFTNTFSGTTTKLVNSTLEASGYIDNVTKENSVSLLRGYRKLGRAKNMDDTAKFQIPDFSYYKKMDVYIQTGFNGSKVNFHVSSFIDGGVVSFIGFTEVASVRYLVSFHYANGNPKSTAIKFFDLNNLTHVLKPESYSIDAFVSDN